MALNDSERSFVQVAEFDTSGSLSTLAAQRTNDSGQPEASIRSGRWSEKVAG
ncbi:MAG: hypothetical protein AAGB10_03940 [Pseudomonadota bacterium]